MQAFFFENKGRLLDGFALFVASFCSFDGFLQSRTVMSEALNSVVYTLEPELLRYEPELQVDSTNTFIPRFKFFSAKFAQFHVTNLRKFTFLSSFL